MAHEVHWKRAIFLLLPIFGRNRLELFDECISWMITRNTFCTVINDLYLIHRKSYAHELIVVGRLGITSSKPTSSRIPSFRPVNVPMLQTMQTVHDPVIFLHKCRYNGALLSNNADQVGELGVVMQIFNCHSRANRPLAVRQNIFSLPHHHRYARHPPVRCAQRSAPSFPPQLAKPLDLRLTGRRY